MKWAIYYGTMLILNILAAVMFFQHINITAMSAIPIFILILMLFQAFLFCNSKIENGFRTAYSVHSELNQAEENNLLYYNANSMLICAPLLLPFILFFSSGLKFICLVVYLLGYSGAIVFRIKNKDKLNNRINSEEKELKIQREKEELGKWK